MMYTPTPDFYNDYIQHFNPFHDPRNGQFASKTTFVSGSSKTQDKSSPYYHKKLTRNIRKELNAEMKSGNKIIVGDAPGIDRQVQDYLKKKKYKNVEVYSPGKQSRYLADKQWKNHLIDDPKHKPMSPEWLAKKDKAMAKVADKGIAVILDEGSGATRNNIKRLQDKNKEVSVYQINPNNKTALGKLLNSKVMKIAGASSNQLPEFLLARDHYNSSRVKKLKNYKQKEFIK